MSFRRCLERRLEMADLETLRQKETCACFCGWNVAATRCAAFDFAAQYTELPRLAVCWSSDDGILSGLEFETVFWLEYLYSYDICLLFRLVWSQRRANIK